MNKLLFILLAVLVFVSCENREPDPVIVPDWLELRLIELENSGDCYGCTVQRWTYKEEFFYHLYCSYWSCSDCEIYRYDGSLVDWELIDHVDFDANKARPEIIWQCGDEL